MARRLTVLLTNIWFAHAGGSEVVVRDIALGLLRRGHRPIVYAPRLGPLADEVAARGVSAIDDLRKLGEPPDIIHAHHSIPCGEALIRFPGTPAINICHSFSFWMEAPVHFPQIGAYVAVDEACRDRLVHREGIDPRRVVVLHNAVDLRRVPVRPRPLAVRPRRALAFGKAAAVGEIAAACAQAGIAYQALGAAAGRVVADPERELVEYDLVFASARAALEALCCGCAVIVCDARGMAGMVTPVNLARLRAGNFGMRCLGETITVERLVGEIGRYDATDAARAAAQARVEADLERLLDAFERLYDEVLGGTRRPAVSAEKHESAVARFLHENLPRRPDDGRWAAAEREQLSRDVAALERLVAQRDRASAEGLPAAAPHDLVARLTAERDEARRARDDALAGLESLKRSRLLLLGRHFRRLLGLPTPY